MGYIMFLVAFVIGYPLFMAAAYFLAKVLFVKIEDSETDERLREARAIKENRLRMRIRKQRLTHAFR
ncbi:MAG TPA: hypothetical protein VD816_07470 [Ohtaekwangia sp.]|nr:hypothetical protein [Ohtaekwangia sp.]